eukprot:gene10907-12066_t
MNALVPYEAPTWTSAINNAPKFYLKLAQRETPIHEWNNLPRVAEGFKISIKRDDMTGSILAGNKIRRLEFLLADAIEQKCDSVITCGGMESNHCRATSLASNLLGLKCHLLLRTTVPEEDKKNCSANVLFDRLSGAKVYLVPNESLRGGLSARVATLAERLWEEKQEKAYQVPLGGSSLVGSFGYIEAFQELINQNVLQDFDDIVVAAGTGGTIGALAIANYLTGSRIKVHGVCICNNADYLYYCIDELIEKYELKEVKAREICDMIDGYKNLGYAKSTDEEIEHLVEIAQATGVVLDPIYTLKATRGMLKEIEINPSRFKGKRIIFLHTGGYYAVYDGRVSDLLLNGHKTQNKDFTIWTDASSNPL